MEITVKTLMGFEELLERELQALGATDTEQGIRVVTCKGDLELVYRANLELRTALRVLLPIDRFMAHDEQSLYKEIKQTDWSKYLDKDGTLWIDAVSNSERFTNSQYLSRLAKDAVVDQFREATGVRPNVEKENPDLRLNIHVGKKGHTTLSIDSSGDGLHRRGYRGRTGMAPLNEVLAAGLLLLAKYDGSQPFVDPMCGSGTIVCEAAMIAANRAPGLNRSFGFQRWKEYDAALWGSLRQKAFDGQRTPQQPIVGADKDGLSLQLAKVAMGRLELEKAVNWVESRFQDYLPPTPTEATPGGIMVTNPPYDMRLKSDDIDKLYKEIGDTLKHNYANYAAYLFSANRDALKRVGLRTNRKVILMNGQLEARLQRYDMYK